MSDSTPAAKRTSRTRLLLLAAIFFVPVAVAFALYYNGWRPSGSTNHGELLQPIRQLPASAASLLGKWTLFHVSSGPCAGECQHALWVARQTRISLNKDMPRIGRALFATPDCCDREFLRIEHQDLKLFAIDATPAGQELLNLLPPGDHASDVFIADPLGNIVMRFDARTNPRGLLDDLKKLLKLSSIG